MFVCYFVNYASIGNQVSRHSSWLQHLAEKEAALGRSETGFCSDDYSRTLKADLVLELALTASAMECSKLLCS